jgi:hypothetical protein
VAGPYTGVEPVADDVGERAVGDDLERDRGIGGEELREHRLDHHLRGRADAPDSFETHDIAGGLDVSESVIAASPDIVSVVTEASTYEAGTPHPQSNADKGRCFIWSRRLHRPLAENDVFAVPPDRALRRLALSRFGNRDALQDPDDSDGLPLSWDHASIGPAGIAWSFGPYELGGYLSGGSAMIPWSALKPYLRRDLPFAIGAIRAAPGRSHAR